MRTLTMKTFARTALLAAALLVAAFAATAHAATGGQVSLDGSFDPERTAYTASVAHDVTEITVNATPSDGKARVTVNGGSPSTPVRLAVGETVITIVVTAEDARYTRTYTVTVTRAAAPEPEPPALPEVSIAAGPDGASVTEGAGATFTVTADPAPASDLAVAVSVSQSGAFAEASALGARTVTIAAGATTASLTVATTDDEADEPDGSVTAALAAGTGYAVAATGGTATVAVADDDAAPPLTASFERVPAEHDGKESFRVDVRFSAALGDGGRAPTAASFPVEGGKVKGVERVGGDLWRVRVKPDSWKDVTVTLAAASDCAAGGAVCAADGRALQAATGADGQALAHAARATIAGPVRIRVADAKGREGRDDTLDFAVTLNRASAEEVSVDYATADGTATAGEDYTAVSGTLTFAAGVTALTVSVPILDDAVDEGKERLHLRLSNPKGAFLRAMHREAKGVIRNDDNLQQAWLSRFGRTVGSQVTDAVSARLEGGLAPGAHATLAGSPVDLAGAEGGRAAGRRSTCSRLWRRPGARARRRRTARSRAARTGFSPTRRRRPSPRAR